MDAPIYTQAIAQFFIDDGRFIVDSLHDGVFSSFVISAEDYPAFIYTVKYQEDLVILIPQHDYRPYGDSFSPQNRQYFKDRGVGFFILSDPDWLNYVMAHIVANATKRPKKRDCFGNLV